MSIRFYEKDDPYYQFSNFSQHKVEILGLTFPTSEHAYQAFKYYHISESGIDLNKIESKYAELIRTSSTPNKAFYLGRKIQKNQWKWQREITEIVKEYKINLRDDWDNIKDNIMRLVVYHKFTQHDLGLIETGNADIIEASPRDSYWGEGKDGEGQNRLGEILMEVRALLSPKLQPKAPTAYSNWNIPYRLLSMSNPLLGGEEYIKEYVDAGLNVYINLQESKEKVYDYFGLEEVNEFNVLPDGTYYVTNPIIDRGIADDDSIASLALYVIQWIGEGKRIAINCLGGKGRTGTLVAHVLGFLYQISGEEALTMTNDQFQRREQKGTKCPYAPQTASQKNQVKRNINTIASWNTLLTPPNID